MDLSSSGQRHEASHRAGPNRKIPKDWLDYPNYGEVIDNCFIALKTPLDSNYTSVPEKNIFTPEMFISEMHQRRINVGMWISLVGTDRYYDKSMFARMGQNHIGHVHLPCQGQSVPDRRIISAFIRTCDTFFSAYPGKIIAVHCTHGLNRTGFMICSYLYERRGWPIDGAINVFNELRFPGIYREKYVEELLAKYSNKPDASRNSQGRHLRAPAQAAVGRAYRDDTRKRNLDKPWRDHTPVGRDAEHKRRPEKHDGREKYDGRDRRSRSGRHSYSRGSLHSTDSRSHNKR